MDKKISEFTAATTLAAVDLIPIVASGDNKSITAGMFAANLPSVGNKGITKNTPTSATVTVITPSTATVIRLTLATHVLGDGVDGQELKLFGTVASTITFTTSLAHSQIVFAANGFCTLRFITGLGWIVESNNSAVTVTNI